MAITGVVVSVAATKLILLLLPLPILIHTINTCLYYCNTVTHSLLMLLRLRNVFRFVYRNFL